MKTKDLPSIPFITPFEFAMSHEHNAVCSSFLFTNLIFTQLILSALVSSPLALAIVHMHFYSTAIFLCFTSVLFGSWLSSTPSYGTLGTVVLQTLNEKKTLSRMGNEKTSQERQNNRDHRKNNDNVFASVHGRSFFLFQN